MRPEYFEKLKGMAGQFQQSCYLKKWSTAKYLYNCALFAAEFLEATEEEQRILFGDRQEEDNITEGLFLEEMVIKAHDECVLKLYQGYENESYRRFGCPPVYYPYPRYPVPGYEKEKRGQKKEPSANGS